MEKEQKYIYKVNTNLVMQMPDACLAQKKAKTEEQQAKSPQQAQGMELDDLRGFINETYGCRMTQVPTQCATPFPFHGKKKPVRVLDHNRGGPLNVSSHTHNKDPSETISHPAQPLQSIQPQQVTEVSNNQRKDEQQLYSEFIQAVRNNEEKKKQDGFLLRAVNPSQREHQQTPFTEILASQNQPSQTPDSEYENFLRQLGVEEKVEQLQHQKMYSDPPLQLPQLTFCRGIINAPPRPVNTAPNVHKQLQQIRQTKQKEKKWKEKEESELKENELKENELKENELKENELKENELKENELKENELKENEFTLERIAKEKVMFLGAQRGFQWILDIVSRDHQAKLMVSEYSLNWRDVYNQQQFPRDMLVEVLGHLHARDLSNVARACRYFCRVTRQVPRLNLRGSRITDTGIVSFLSDFNELRDLDIRDCPNITADGAQYLVEMFPSLSTLKLNRDGAIGDKYLHKIQVFALLPNLRELHVCSDIPIEGVKALARLQTLQRLVIRGVNRLFSSSQFDRALNQLLSSLPNLTYFFLQLTLTKDAIPITPNYSLQQVHLGWVDGPALDPLDHFLGAAHLVSIQLGSIPMTLLMRFLKRFGPHLQELDLSFCTQLMDCNCPDVAQLCPNVTTLYLPYTLSDAAIGAFAPCTHLSSLTVSPLGKKLTPHALILAIDTFPCLTRLELKSLNLSNISPIVRSAKQGVSKQINIIVC